MLPPVHAPVHLLLTSGLNRHHSTKHMLLKPYSILHADDYAKQMFGQDSDRLPAEQKERLVCQQVGAKADVSRCASHSPPSQTQRKVVVE